jgi:P-type conjugative transfer protein TrbG
MKQKFTSSLFLLLLTSLSTIYAADPLADQYFSHNELVLTSQEKTALAIGQHWQTGEQTSKSVASADGAIKFIFGNGQTQIVCAVLQVCDIELQPGEQVTVDGLNAGDPRYTVEPAVSNTASAQVIHLLLKPLDVGLDTSLVVNTNRRTYHFRLRSSRTRFMPYVSFIYPEDLQDKWKAMEQTRQQNTLPTTGEYLGDLDFKYKISGSASWKPVRVYNDGVKTIIEMPQRMQQTDAPTLLVVRDGRGLFSSSQNVVVNYRVQNNRYIVDSVFDKAILIVGVGRQQNRITITKES